MTIAYDGTNYSGWQVQPNAITIQEIIETALSKLLRTPTKVRGSGRTDAGVHANGQVAHFRAEEIDTKATQYKLNQLLPKDISILAIEPVSEDFHACFSAKSKTYVYHIHTSPTECPFSHPFRYKVHYTLDLDAIKQAIPYFEGTHDFTSFANKNNQGAAVTSPIKTIYSIRLEKTDGGYTFTFHGNGFLYKMVRNIMGTLLRIGTGRLPAECIPKLMAGKDRRPVPMAAPAKGLFLQSVEYPSQKLSE